MASKFNLIKHVQEVIYLDVQLSFTRCVAISTEKSYGNSNSINNPIN